MAEAAMVLGVTHWKPGSVYFHRLIQEEFHVRIASLKPDGLAVVMDDALIPISDALEGVLTLVEIG